MHIPLLPEFGPWSVAHFHTVGARDRFLMVVAAQELTEVEATPMPHENRAALVRWRPGQFLGLNDVAHANGGRIIVRAMRRRE